jgi:hypothetical protein
MLVPLILSSLVALSSAPPVRLAACNVSTPTTLQGDNGPTTVGAYAVAVRFSNTAPEPISHVTFTLDDGTKVIDVGMFSPGITIDHTFGLPSSNATSCSVTAVTFADGTTWNANDRI